MANPITVRPFPPPKPGRFPSNVAAEFVEVRAGHEICRRATTGDIAGGASKMETPRGSMHKTPSGVVTTVQVEEPAPIEPWPTFVRALDRFMPTSEAPFEEAYYTESKRMMEQFQQTLKIFIETPHMRKVFKHYGISAREPSSYDVDYIARIETLVGEYGDEADKTRLIKKFMRSCFQKANRHMETLKCLLSMVPTDAYGSVISGGFSLILLAIERHQDARSSIQTALATIPRMLSQVRKLTTVHIRSAELHGCADRLFVSIFALLERIVAQLSRTNWLQKTRHEGDILRAVQDMNDRVRDLKDEVDVCGHLRLGRMDEQIGRATRVVQDVYEGQQDIKDGIGDLSQCLKSGVWSALYQLVASSLEHDPAQGSCK